MDSRAFVALSSLVNQDTVRRKKAFKSKSDKYTWPISEFPLLAGTFVVLQPIMWGIAKYIQWAKWIIVIGCLPLQTPIPAIKLIVSRKHPEYHHRFTLSSSTFILYPLLYITFICKIQRGNGQTWIRRGQDRIHILPSVLFNRVCGLWTLAECLTGRLNILISRQSESN